MLVWKKIFLYIFLIIFGFFIGKNFDSIKEKYPDAAGTCIKKEDSSKGGRFDFVCPTSDYIDCMPGPGPKKTECNPTYLKWVQENCPNFKGVAY